MDADTPNLCLVLSLWEDDVLLTKVSRDPFLVNKLSRDPFLAKPSLEPALCSVPWREVLLFKPP